MLSRLFLMRYCFTANLVFSILILQIFIWLEQRLMNRLLRMIKMSFWLLKIKKNSSWEIKISHSLINLVLYLLPKNLWCILGGKKIQQKLKKMRLVLKKKKKIIALSKQLRLKMSYFLKTLPIWMQLTHILHISTYQIQTKMNLTMIYLTPHNPYFHLIPGRIIFTF